jgi:hypothetical protein
MSNMLNYVDRTSFLEFRWKFPTLFKTFRGEFSERVGSVTDTANFLQRLETTCLKHDVSLHLCGSDTLTDVRDHWEYLPETDVFRGAFFVSLNSNGFYHRLKP